MMKQNITLNEEECFLLWISKYQGTGKKTKEYKKGFDRISLLIIFLSENYLNFSKTEMLTLSIKKILSLISKLENEKKDFNEFIFQMVTKDINPFSFENVFENEKKEDTVNIYYERIIRSLFSKISFLSVTKDKKFLYNFKVPLESYHIRMEEMKKKLLIERNEAYEKHIAEL